MRNRGWKFLLEVRRSRSNKTQLRHRNALRQAARMVRILPPIRPPIMVLDISATTAMPAITQTAPQRFMAH